MQNPALWRSVGGVAPGSDEANRLAEKHRALISQLSDCTHSMQVCLGQNYVADERFTVYFDAFEPRLSEWLAAIINANAERYGIDPDSAEWQ